MGISTKQAVTKVLYWQQKTIIILTFIILVFWGLVISDVIWGFQYDYIKTYYRSTLCYIVACSLATDTNYLLYKSWSSLKNYQESEYIADLELAFRKQRYFWMVGPLLLLFFLVVLIGSMIFSFLAII